MYLLQGDNKNIKFVIVLYNKLETNTFVRKISFGLSNRK